MSTAFANDASTNIGNARLNGLERDLKLSDYDYRIALTILYDTCSLSLSSS